MKKAWNTIKSVLSWLLIIFTMCVVMFTVISLRTVDARQRNILGYKLMIVQSDSMSATDFNAGDLIFVKEVDPATLKEGDVISFVSRNSHNPGDTVTHKIRSLTVDENGWSGFITYGTTTDTDDEAIVRYSDVLGIYVGRIEGLGVFFTFLRTPKGYISFILIPLLLMIFFSLFNCIRMFSNAQKQVEEEHRTAVEEERRKNDQMRQELEELRAMIMANTAAAPPKTAGKQGAPSGTKKPGAAQKPASQKKPAEAAQAVPSKKPETPKQPAQKGEAAPVKKPETPKQPARKEEAAPAKKPGKFAAAPDQKNAGVLPERKPTTRAKKPEGYDELDLDNIVAEFRPRPKKPL